MNNCTCNKNDELRIVRGNAFSLRLTVRALRIDGTPVEDFDLSQANAVLKVEHLGTKTEKTFTVIDNDSVIGFDNTLALGWYGLEMTGSYNDAPWRWYVEKVFCIVETNAKANIPAWAILTDDTYMIDVITSITSGDIYQSDWAETNPQSPSYIQNKPNVVTHEEYDPTIIAINKAISDEETRAKAAEKANADNIDDIEALIPAQATPQNQLADKQYVDDGIATASATYRGAYNLVSDLELTVAATEQQIAAALATKMTALGITPDNNDYCFVQVPTADAMPTEIARVDRYKFNGTAWAFEFSLNNSGFTAAQWAALNSGITSGLVTKLSDLPTNSELTILLNGKEDNSNKVTSLSAESTDTQYPSAKCVYDLHKANADDIDDIKALIPAQATPQNQLADKQYVDDGIATASATYRGAYNLVSDLELTVAATEQQIAAALATKMTALGITPDNNDYCFVQVPTADAMPTEIARVERYKFNGTAWAFEFSLNNSGFTAAQWAALNSGITSGLVTKLSDLPTNSELTILLNGKEDNSNKVTSLSAESTDTQYPSAKCVYDLHKANADDIDAIEEKIPSDASSSNKMATASDITNLSDSIAAILLLIPSAASSLNQLADKSFVNSSIATNTATYRGSYNLVSDLSLTISATEQQIAAALATKMTALSITPENNDYCFVQVPTADATPTEISRIDRYKYNGTAWLYEYSLNNSSFTSAQWAAINSGITSALVAKLSALPTNAELTTALGVLTDGIAAINAKIPSAATSSNKLVDNTAMQSYVAQIVNALDATFNITSSDGHVTVQITQTNGVITALAITTSDIASAAALNLLSGRVTTAEGNISTNATDIANLQQLYNNLQQSDPIIIEPTDTWPVANPSTHDIYRVIDRVNTPPQYYSDYMWNGTTMVLMAQYDNAIDDEPTPGSNNLVKSGGVAANIVYDISRAHASGSTLATYVDLAAALGSNGANIPEAIRKGGMSVKYVQTSDNKYVQYRLMADEFTTDTTQWAIVVEGVYIENPEFVYVQTDAEGKILWAIKTDGDIHYGAGVPQQIIDYINERIAELSLDEYEDIVAFLNGLESGEKTLSQLLAEKADAETVIAALATKVDEVEGKSLIDEDVANGIHYEENPEFLEATTDSEGKILAGRTPDGAAFENVGFSTTKLSIDGHTIKNIKDPEERTEITTDSEGKIISYRDSEGVKHESVGIRTNHLELSPNATQDLINALDALGYNANNPIDWSDSKFIELPLPDVCAIINIEVDSQAEAKGLNIPTHIQFWDKNGNYFRKPVLLNAQGDSSMVYWIKNQAIDLDDGSTIKFGNWVPQNSFHIKKYYIDAFRGQCIVAYWLTEQMYQTRRYGDTRPWSYLNQGGDMLNAIGKFKQDYETGALAHPDGFPVHIFFNGKDAGIYAFNLKKHRDNYYCKKDNGKNIILDGKLDNAEIFGGNIDWTAFEIRNPKGLKDIDGNKYDGDNPKELSDTDSLSAQVKGYIQDFSQACAAIEANRTKEEFEKYFIVPFFIDYFLISQVLYHFDGFWKNWIWCTWDGKMWTPTSYDMDSIFGADTNGTKVIPIGNPIAIGNTSVDVRSNSNQVLGFSASPIQLLWSLYQEEIKTRYKELRDKKIFDTDNIVALLENWVKKCGYDNLKDDIEKICAVDNVPQTPSYRDGSQTYAKAPTTGGFYNSILRVRRWLDAHFKYLDRADIFNYNHI